MIIKEDQNTNSNNKFQKVVVNNSAIKPIISNNKITTNKVVRPSNFISKENLPNKNGNLPKRVITQNNNQQIPLTNKNNLNPNRQQKKPFLSFLWRRKLSIVALFLVAILLGIGIYSVSFYNWANSQLHRVSALSSKANTSGTTYLIAGSDRRIKEVGPKDKTEGARSDSIMLLHKPPHGKSSLVSIPRDSFVQIPGYGKNKINAAYSFGGPKLLVKTVELLTGMKVNHFIESNFEGIVSLVNAVDGVRVCYKHNVNDKKSKMNWKSGCHNINGVQALAFSRMRYSDPLGDVGRANRQRQVISAIAKKVITPQNILFPSNQHKLVQGATDGFVVDKTMTFFDLIKMFFAFKDATGSNGVSGVPTIKSMGYWGGPSVGSAVLLDPVQAPKDFKAIQDGTWKPKKKK